MTPDDEAPKYITHLGLDANMLIGVGWPRDHRVLDDIVTACDALGVAVLLPQLVLTETEATWHVALERRARLVPGQASAGLHICIYMCIFDCALRVGRREERGPTCMSEASISRSRRSFSTVQRSKSRIAEGTMANAGLSRLALPTTYT